MNQSTNKAVTYFKSGFSAWSGVAMMGAAATVALIYAITELSGSQEYAGSGIDETWLGHWVVIWVSGIAVFLALAAPFLSAWSDKLAGYRNEQQFFEMMKVQPSLKQEWLAMKSRDVEVKRKTRVIAEIDKESMNQALEALGGFSLR